MVFMLLMNRPVFSADNAELVLEEAKKFAIENSPRVKSSRDNMLVLKAEKDLTNSAYYPRVGLVGGVSSYGDFQEDFGPVAYGYLTYNLFNQFIDDRASKLADIDLERAKLLLAREEFLVGLDVEELFYTYVYYSELLSLQEKAIEQNNDHKALVSKTKKAGTSTETDVMEFRLKEAILRSDKELLKQRLQETRMRLKMLLGEKFGSDVTPAGVIQHQHLKGSLNSYLERVKTSGLSVKIASLDFKETQAKSTSWQSSWMPRVDLSVMAGRLPSEIPGEREENNVSLLLTANYELFSGFESREEKKKRDFQLSRDEHNLKQNLLSATTEMEIIFKRLVTIEKRVDLEAQGVNRTYTYYRLVSQEYLRGYKNSSDLASAADRYTESRRRKVQFMYEFLVEKIKLERTMGAEVDVEIVN